MDNPTVDVVSVSDVPNDVAVSDVSSSSPDADASDSGNGNDTPNPPADAPPPGFAATHAIVAAKCSPCHTTPPGSGGHAIGQMNQDTGYMNSQLAAVSLPGSTKGAALLFRVQMGEMPLGRGCSGNPATDAMNAACLTAAEQATLRAWIMGGQRR
jgi:hypothetical protein